MLTKEKKVDNISPVWGTFLDTPNTAVAGGEYPFMMAGLILRGILDFISYWKLQFYIASCLYVMDPEERIAFYILFMYWFTNLCVI